MIANLPFLTVAQLMGTEVFLESFHHPGVYQYINAYQVNDNMISKGYLILETTSHQPCLIQNGDTILYRTGEGAVRCEQVLNVALRQGIAIYYTLTSGDCDIKGPIYKAQILGKVTSTIDDNIWNALCLQLWDFSTKNLNALAYLDTM